MNVTVKFFSFYQHIAGMKQVVLSMSYGGTLGDLLNILEELVPQLFPAAEYARFLVNESIASPQTVLADGDQILMLGVIAGG